MYVKTNETVEESAEWILGKPLKPDQHDYESGLNDPIDGTPQSWDLKLIALWFLGLVAIVGAGLVYYFL